MEDGIEVVRLDRPEARNAMNSELLDAVEQALAIDRPPGGGDPPFLVVPVTNTAGAVPGSNESSTAVISYFAFPPIMSLESRMQAVGRYMQDARRAGAPVVGRTGILPAQLHEGSIVEDALPWVEAATVLMVALVVGLMFRSFGAPALTLATVAAVLTLMTGCVVGPDYVRPTVITPDAYKEVDGWKVAQPKDKPAAKKKAQ